MNTKKTPKVLVGLLVILMICSTLFAGCSKSEPESNSQETVTEVEKVKVGLSVGTLTDERWQRDVDMFKAAAEKYDFELIIQSAELDAQKQVSQCENMISSGIDVLIIQPQDSDAAGVIIDTAHEDGVPVIAYDRLINNSDLDYYVTFDSVKVGEVEAQFVIDKVSKGNFIWLMGDPKDNNAHLVKEGHANVLQPYIDNGDINIVLEQACTSWLPEQALQHVENGLTMIDNDLQAIIAPNDGTAGGSIQALKAQGLAGKVPIAGQDADIAACQRIVEGTQTGTVYKPLAKLNEATVEIILAIINEVEPKEVVGGELGIWTTINNKQKDVDSFYVDVVAVDKDNMMDTVIADGFHSQEEVYKNIPKDQWPK